MAGTCSKAGSGKGVFGGQLARLSHLINWVPETRTAYREMSDCQKLYLALCQLSLLDSTISVPMCRPVSSWTVVGNTMPDVTPECISDPHLLLSSRFSKNPPLQDYDFYLPNLFSLFCLDAQGSTVEILSASCPGHCQLCMMHLLHATGVRTLVLRPRFLLGTYALLSPACLNCFLCLRCDLTHCPHPPPS